MESPHSNNTNQDQPASRSPRNELVKSQQAEGEQSCATLSAQPPTTAPEMEPSHTAAVVTPTHANTMQLEIPPGYNDDAPPVPAAQTDVAYNEMENASKIPIENTSNSCDASPLPAAQLAALFEDMEDAMKMKGFIEDGTPLLHDAEIAKFYEEMGNKKKGEKHKLQIVEDSESAMSVIPSSSDIRHSPPTVLQVSSESPSPRTIPSENSQTRPRRGQRQAAAVIRCPPQTMVASLNDEARPPSVPMFHEVEATLFRNKQVYDAVPIQNNDDKPLPWWKRHQQYICGGVGLLSVGFAVTALMVSLRSSNRVNVKGSKDMSSIPPSESSSPSQAPPQSVISSPIPSPHPTYEPSQSFAPSNLPSLSSAPTETPSLRSSTQPSTSFSPSTYFSSLVWKQQGQTLVGDSARDESGRSVALSGNGNTLAIGSPGRNDNEDRPGYVKVYRREDTESSWELVHTISGYVDGDRFGRSVSFSEDGNTLAIGSAGYWGNDDRPGYVRVYHTEGSGLSWQQLGLDINGEALGDRSGESVSLSGDGKTLAIGASTSKDKNGSASGHVRVFYMEEDDKGSIWKQIGQDIDGKAANDWLGWAVFLSADGKTLAIGAPFNDENGLDAGQVSVFYMEEDDKGSIWKQLGQDIDGEAADDWFGCAVSLSADGKILAIGANNNDGNGINSGHARVYHMEDNGSGLSWKQLGQDIDGKEVWDRSGWSVSLSVDGKTLAVGAIYNDNNSGHVRVYHIDVEGIAPSWKQLGQDINGESAYDWSGMWVSLSSDGKTVAIGSPYNTYYDGSEDQSGHVRVFNIDY